MYPSRDLALLALLAATSRSRLLRILSTSSTNVSAKSSASSQFITAERVQSWTRVFDTPAVESITRLAALEAASWVMDPFWKRSSTVGSSVLDLGWYRGGAVMPSRMRMTPPWSVYFFFRPIFLPMMWADTNPQSIPDLCVLVNSKCLVYNHCII